MNQKKFWGEEREKQESEVCDVRQKKKEEEKPQADETSDEKKVEEKQAETAAKEEEKPAEPAEPPKPWKFRSEQKLYICSCFMKMQKITYVYS